jgi:hypothetical protein
MVCVCGIVLALAMAACRSPQPVPPTRIAAPAATLDSAFDAGQRARLDRLREAFADPVASEFASGLLVRLAFEDVADLDLFVTDPALESVYFAYTPARSGGVLVDDRACGDPAPRVEIVHFADPLPGRYRVGVDFHRRCEAKPSSTRTAGVAGEGLYRVRVDEGGRVLEREGLLTPGLFEVIVLEFEVGADGAAE